MNEAIFTLLKCHYFQYDLMKKSIHAHTRIHCWYEIASSGDKFIGAVE